MILQDYKANFLSPVQKTTDFSYCIIGCVSPSTFMGLGLRVLLFKQPPCSRFGQELLDVAALLRQIIVDHKITFQSQFIEGTVDWLHATCKATLAKLELLGQQLRAEAYTPDTLAALKRVRYCLLVPS
jgi:hypothetical protein